MAIVAPALAGVAVGDFFVSTWGYDQTNVDFYKVVGLTPKGVKVQEWSNAQADDEEQGGPVTHVVPGEGPATRTKWGSDGASPEEMASCKECGPFSLVQYGVTGQASRHCETHGPKRVEVSVETKRLQSYDGGKTAYFTVNSFSSARKWEGSPVYETGQGWGH